MNGTGKDLWTSLTYIGNNKGPNIDPWGTPTAIRRVPERERPTAVLWQREVK